MVITASPLDAQRLSDEIAWLTPGLHPPAARLGNFTGGNLTRTAYLSTLYAISPLAGDISVPSRRGGLAPPLAAYAFFLSRI